MKKSIYTKPPYKLSKRDVFTSGGHNHYYWSLYKEEKSIMDGEEFDSTGIAIVITPVENATKAIISERIATADFIVTACNAHDELVEALEKINNIYKEHRYTERCGGCSVDYHDDGEPYNECRGHQTLDPLHSGEVCNIAFAALKKAGVKI